MRKKASKPKVRKSIMRKVNMYERFFQDYWKIVRRMYPKCVRSGLVIGWVDGMFFVPNDNLSDRWPPSRKREFDGWMEGQTMFQYGCYASDVERFLNDLPVID